MIKINIISELDEIIELNCKRTKELSNIKISSEYEIKIGVFGEKTPKQMENEMLIKQYEIVQKYNSQINEKYNNINTKLEKQGRMLLSNPLI